MIRPSLQRYSDIKTVKTLLLTLEKLHIQLFMNFNLNRMNRPITYSLFYLKKNIMIGLTLILTMVQIADLSAQDGEYTVYYYDDGKVSSEGYLLDGKPNGYWTTYYPSGQIKSEGNREKFQLDSIWVFYDEEGLITSKITYENGIKNGEVLTYNNGALYEKAILENDKRTGVAEIYFPTGEVQKEIPYEDDLEEGEGFEYARDGRVITLLKYREGYLKSAERINRYDDRGKKRGKWITFYPNGNIHVEGTYMNDKKNGIFKTFDKDGDLISLEKYRDDQLVVDSEESVILDLRNSYYPNGEIKSTGGYVDGKKEGTHRYYDNEGNIEGAEIYHRGEKTAAGIIDEKGDYQGLWKLYYDTGELKAEGEFENSNRIGEWVFYHKNGEIEHRAKYVDGLPQGRWTWYFDNGNLRREEYYRRGKEDGESIEYDIEGNEISRGEYVSGYKDGEWFYNVGDHTEKGSYLDGERNGEWIYEYPEGELNYEGEYAMGLAIGKHKWYYPNGQLKKEGKYSSGVRVGTWKTYDENGVQELVVKYKNGQEVKINGRKVYSESETEVEEELSN
jgi:antitoxin component YwqK of YwqJK toxin-antitoxin module